MLRQQLEVTVELTLSACYSCVMPRLNLTLDIDTYSRLEGHARRHDTPRSAFARQLIDEALTQREADERREKLAADYASEREEAESSIVELEVGQLEVIGDEENETERVPSG